MNQENLLNKIRQKDAKAFTHGGKFHADDIFFIGLVIISEPGNSDYKGKSGAGRV